MATDSKPLKERVFRGEEWGYSVWLRTTTVGVDAKTHQTYTSKSEFQVGASVGPCAAFLGLSESEQELLERRRDGIEVCRTISDP